MFYFSKVELIIGVYKQYHLIAGVNTMPKKELAKMDLEYIGKWFGIFSGIFGFIMFVFPFVFKYLGVNKYNSHFFGIVILTYVGLMLLYFNIIKKDRIFRNNTNRHDRAKMHSR